MSKVLIVYYSRPGENLFGAGTKILKVGNTKIVAETLHNLLNCDIVEIESNKKYPTTFKECRKEALEEKMKQYRPEIQISVDITKYEMIFLGYPIWCETVPMSILTFLEKYDFTGKKIAPFCTHEGSEWGTSLSDIQMSAKGATILQGLSIEGTSRNNCEFDLLNWINTLMI
ncbi:flavodoxin [Tritrichomonas foetus]|uniref:Flavodoxin n=1 Tax=Tritrichomonas foetus TaxID=1144522 RepID=A0A1J4JLK1_9EUKA|nr:flavodoxin [Tritrichomonas foetus]|eukprot:OHS99279.1 flavodoxin [Tritrichomonas foetus]